LQASWPQLIQKGVESENIGVSVKHFAANDQEYRRMSVSAEVDERTLREIYLPAFEAVVREAKPDTLMCSYNRINGVYSCENKWLLTDVLRKDWGFEGYVMTDWGAMNDRVAALKAGLELEMPSSNGVTDRQIVEAVKDGSLDEKILDTAVGADSCRRLQIYGRPAAG
jgi:beta-glucosidase